MSQSTTVAPVSAFASFADLSVRPTTQSALRRMNIETPTRIQAETLPLLLAGRDVIGQSRTGSGKTLAFGIPAVESVDGDLRAVQVLILTPTRELAVQVGSVLSELTQGTNIRVALVYGGRAIGPQISELRRGAQIVVGTPGRVADIYQQRALVLDKVRFLVLDEADEMLDRGFAPQVNKILGWVPGNRQTALFSATMPEWVDDASHRHLRNPAHVAVASTQAESEQIDHIAYDVPSGGKLDALKDLLDARGDGQVIVFGRTKHGVRKLARQMEAAGYPVAALQGNLSQNARDAVMADFRAGKVPVLFATNVAARGIDVTAVDFVINYELPESSELLSHRIGRTGRMGNSGQAITLLSDDDGAKWRQLERGLGKRIPRQAWTGARRTDATPVLIEHNEPRTNRSRNERPARNERPQQSRSERPQGERSRRPDSRDGQETRRPMRAHASDRPERNERDEPRTSAPRPNALSVSIIEEMKRERRGNMAPPPPRRPELEMPPLPRNRAPRPEYQDRPERSDTSRSERSERPTRSGSSYGNAPRGPQVQVSNGRPSFGAMPVAGSEDRDDAGNRETRRPDDRRGRSNADKRATGRRHADSMPASLGGPSGTSNGSGETFSATCSQCGGTATLRFAPDLSRPIYCDTCFAERRKSRGQRPAPSAY
ncbi:MAG TPA: DEAD/DEAH box helicase [Thermomicrobiales bacterium]|nr:DEAD/DEAH box helicase [Thermomicrobiales bacterium]